MRTQFASLLICLVASGAYAQAQDDQKATVVTIDELSAPTTPAFVLLGVTPESVDKPDTPKAFVFNTFSKLSDGFPKDFAMQIAPYWMKSNPTLTFEEYQRPSVSQSIKQTFALSVGTSPIPAETKGAEPLGTHLAIGFTVRPWNGKPSAALKTLVDGKLTAKADVVLDDEEKRAPLVDRIKQFQSLLESELKAIASGEAEQPPADTTRSQARVVFLQTRLSGMNDELTRLDAHKEKALKEVSEAALAVQALDAKRIGFFLTISGGQVWDFASDDVRNAVSKRHGLWVTPAWRAETCPKDNAGCGTTIDAVFVARLLKDPDADSIFDLGGRLIWSLNKEFSMSAEFVRRNPGESTGTSDDSTDSSNRAAGILQYRVSDDLILFGTFGQDFKKATGEKPLLTLIGLNVGLGSKAVIKQ